MNEHVDDLIAMNQSGLVLALCEKYYAENVLMLSNGSVFAESMKQAYDKQKGFVDSIKTFEVKLVSKTLIGNVADLIFHYKMTSADTKVTEYMGRHIQTWIDGKIVKEEYESVD